MPYVHTNLVGFSLFLFGCCSDFAAVFFFFKNPIWKKLIAQHPRGIRGDSESHQYIWIVPTGYRFQSINIPQFGIETIEVQVRR